MKIFNTRVMLICTLLVLSACTGNTHDSTDESRNIADQARSNSGLNYDAMDLSIRPQDDFYSFVNGSWLTKKNIPSDKSQYGSFDIIYERTQDRLYALIQEAAQADIVKSINSQKLGDIYNSFMNEEVANRLKFEPLYHELVSINQIKSFNSLSEKLGHLSKLGVDTPIGYWVYPDAKAPTKYALWLHQSGLTLPNRDYYLNSAKEFTSYQSALKSYITDLFHLMDYKQAKKRAEGIYALEVKIAKQHVNSVDSVDPALNYNKLNAKQMTKMMDKFNWNKFSLGAGSPAKAVIVENLSFYEGFSEVYASTPLEAWKDYLTFKLVDRYAKYMHEELVNKHFDFHKRTLQGVKKIKPRSKRAVSTTSNVLGGVLGEEYTKEYFSLTTKSRIEIMVKELFAAYQDTIKTSDWMSSATKKAALVKLSKITAKIGYPQKWRDYSSLKIKADDLVGNIMRFYQFDNKFRMGKVGDLVDRDYWLLMTPQTVDAYYSAVENEVAFPAAIIQAPFFDLSVDDAVNYGSIGWFIGHELGHAFDNQGAQYDGEGNLSNWWNDKDYANFNILGNNLANQYSQFEVLPNLYINGELTKSENIADLTGVSIAYKAYKKSLGGRRSSIIDGYTGEQRFFMGYAQMWRAQIKADSVRMMVTSDQHTPPRYRVNGPLKNVSEFYEAFNVKPGDHMYLSPEKRAVFW